MVLPREAKTGRVKCASWRQPGQTSRRYELRGRPTGEYVAMAVAYMTKWGLGSGCSGTEYGRNGKPFELRRAIVDTRPQLPRLGRTHRTTLELARGL